MPGDLMLTHYKQIFSEDALDPLRIKADEWYEKMTPLSLSANWPHLYAMPEGGIFVKRSSSFTLEAVLGYEETINFIHLITKEEVLAGLLPECFYVNVDQCWVRRQHSAADNRHSPHSWHQDGALAFPFADTKADHTNGLLDMCVIWVPLCDGGTEAPGLEFIDFHQSGVLTMQELADAKLRSKYPEKLFLKPSFSYGDVLVFGGNMVHRTYALPQMTKYRTSLGIRVFANIPERCGRDRFIQICEEA